MSSSQDLNKPENLRGPLAVSPAQVGIIEKIAQRLKKQTPSLFVLLVDRNGQIVHFSGEGPQQAGLAELAALLAGDLAASKEIARLTSSYQQQQLVLREGENQISYLCEAGPDLVLFMQTAPDVPLGWSRLLIQEARTQLAELTLRSSENGAGDHTPIDVTSFEKNLDEAIDGLWS